MSSPWYVYILECGDTSYYVGITTDLERRLKMHNAGVASRYTRAHLPVTYRYAEPIANQSEARKREIELKKWMRPRKEALFALPSNLIPSFLGPNRSSL